MDHEKVNNWLESVLGEVPDYEVNSETLQILTELCERCQHSEEMTSFRLEDFQRKTEEYRNEAKRMEGILKQLGLSEDALSNSGKKSLKTLVDTATVLETRDATETSLCLAMSDLSMDLNEGSQRHLEETMKNNRLSRKTTMTLAKLQQLQRELAALDEESKTKSEDEAKKLKKSNFLQNKTADYTQQIQKLQLDLNSSGADKSIYHETLVERSEELKQLKEQIRPLQAKLDSYHDLPANPSMVKVKIEEAKKALAELEEKLNKKMDWMHL